MENARFDRIARLLGSRRAVVTGVLGGGLAGGLIKTLSQPDRASAAKKCGRGKKRCGKRCITKRKCCTNANCRSKGAGKVCQNGTCRCPQRSPACGAGCCPEGKRCIGQACWPDAEEAAFISLLNNYRTASGLPALRLQHQLGTAAELHSRDQARSGKLSHTGSDGSNPGGRIIRAGYAFSGWGENVYRGGGAATAAFNAWKQSSGHNANMLSTRFTEVGIGRAQGSAGQWYWTTTFGTPRR